MRVIKYIIRYTINMRAIKSNIRYAINLRVIKSNIRHTINMHVIKLSILNYAIVFFNPNPKLTMFEIVSNFNCNYKSVVEPNIQNKMFLRHAGDSNLKINRSSG